MKLAHSPLFEPVLWEGGGFRVLDELSLPERTEYITVSEVSQALAAVRDMKTRAFGQVLTFLYSGALLAQRYQARDATPLREAIAAMTQQFCDARPTFDFKGLGGSFAAWFAELPTGAAVGEWIATQARDLGAQIVKARQSRAKRAASLLPQVARVLTHCNVSGELVAVAHYCKEMGKAISVIATETRPYLQGTRLTAWELSQAGVSVSLIPDCAVAQVMAKGGVNAVVVGSDRCAQNGDVINKVGTYPLALMAKEYGIPFFALVQNPGPLVRGEDVQIEERPIAELLIFQGHTVIPESGEYVTGRYPAFDVTPARLVTFLVGFDDSFTPESFRQRFLESSSTAAKNAKKTTKKYLLVYGLPKEGGYAFLMHALKAEQAERLLVPEMRPGLLGARVVAAELLRRHAPATLISDNMMGTLFAEGQIQRLYLFYSGVDEQGVSGLCGSLLALRLARAHGVPIELLESEEAKESPVDRDVSTFLGQRVIPAGASVFPLENEVIPWALFKENGGGDA